jgi:hypothetical protein
MNIDGKKCKQLISSLLQGQKVNWPKEMKLAKKLIAFCDDMAFWEQVKKDLHKDYDLCSLSYYLTQNGKASISKQKNAFFLDKTKKTEYTLQEEKVSEDVNVETKMKTLKDFLKNG